MKKQILITGGSGFLGGHLEKRLGKKYECLINWDLKIDKDIFDSNIELDIRQSDVVVHLAAEVNVNQSFEHPERFYYTNVLGTARIAQLCYKHGVKLIYPSSAAVAFPDLSPYAKSKYLAEEILKSFSNVVILRLSNVFGEGMNKDSGSIMYRFLHDDEITIYGNGEQTRDYIHINDVSSIIEASFDESWNGQIVEVGTGDAFSTNFVAGLFLAYRSNLKNKKIKYELPRREVKWSTADTQMLKTLYKKPLKTDLVEDIGKLCQKKEE